MRVSLRWRSIVASRRGTMASIPARNGPNDPDISSRGSGRLNDGRMTTGLSPARKVDDASVRDVDRSELPKKDAVGDQPSEPEEEEEEEEKLPPEIAAAMDDYGGGGRGGRGGQLRQEIAGGKAVLAASYGTYPSLARGEVR
jgi:hypothetical protein